MNKKLIRLTESDLHRIVKESVKRVLSEAKYDSDFFTDYYLTHAPRTKFSRDDGGKASMDTLRYINDGGMAPEDTALPWDWGNNGMEGMQDTYHRLKGEREINTALNRKERNNMKRALDAADKRPLHRKGSLNRIGMTESSSYDMLKYDTIQEYGNDDPMNLSDSELRSRIEYMLAYRWALEGQEYILDDYMEEARSRGI